MSASAVLLQDCGRTRPCCLECRRRVKSFDKGLGCMLLNSRQIESYDFWHRLLLT